MSAVGFCLVCSTHYDADSFVGHSCTTPRRFTCGGCGEAFEAYEFWMHHCDFHDSVLRLFKPAADFSPSCAGAGPSGTAVTQPNRGHLRVVPAPADSQDSAS